MIFVVSFYFEIAVCIVFFVFFFSLNVSNREHYWTKLDLLMLFTTLGPKLMASCHNSNVYFFIFVVFNVGIECEIACHCFQAYVFL